MRRMVALGVSVVMLGLALPAGLLEAQGPASPVYKPPLRGAPGGRVGGGTRGTGREEFILSALAPNHTGLTTREQPSLYWFISRPSSSPIEITVVDPNATDPVLETRLAPPVTAGVHMIRLADHNVRLKPGVPYQWYVAVVPDSGRRSRDILAGGAVERVDTPAELATRVGQVSKRDLPALYADAGIWYDAVAAMEELVAATPTDQGLLTQRDELLRQAGLPTPLR